MSTTETNEFDWLKEMFETAVPMEGNPEFEAYLNDLKAQAEAQKAALAAAEAAAQHTKNANTCPRCSGSGKLGFRRANGICFRCMGSGIVE